jgi:two-component system LytT family response regulator
MLTAVIIDDEFKGRIALKQKLQDYCPNIELVGEAENGEEGMRLIGKHQPRIVFLT